jgi:uncharacterized Fe-S cluster-containing MiaB family protein
LLPPATSAYPASAAERDRWILSLRGTRNEITTDLPFAFLNEQEPAADSRLIDTVTIFLTGRECPWRCLMCDLWKNTTKERTPVGAIPAQIDHALNAMAERNKPRRSEEAEGMESRPARRGTVLRTDHFPTSPSRGGREGTPSFQAGRPRQIKLYNSGSFFDRAAVPVEDYESIVIRVAMFDRVIVESHPSLIGDNTWRFRDLLSNRRPGGTSTLVADDSTGLPAGSRQHPGLTPGGKIATDESLLEVALGLETAHPDVLDKLNKRFDLDDFAKAAAALHDQSVALRVFVLVKPPFMDEDEGVEWSVRSAEFAFDCGATVVSLIPTRFGNGALERLATEGHFSPPSLISLETAFERCLALGRGRIFADLWDLEKFSRCSRCLPERRRRLAEMNLRQIVLPAVTCVCG